MATAKDNMKLWNSVCVSDKKFLKTVNQRGGFISICAQSQRKVATKQWGSYGDAWGVKDLKFGMVCSEEATLDAVFYYPSGSFEISTDCAYRAGNDTRKKLLTDLTTKALSMLGFNSDVFEGEFDGNKYDKSHDAPRPQTTQTQTTRTPPPAPLPVSDSGAEAGAELEELLAQLSEKGLGTKEELLQGFTTFGTFTGITDVQRLVTHHKGLGWLKRVIQSAKDKVAELDAPTPQAQPVVTSEDLPF